MRIPIDRMTCWELIDYISSEVKKMASDTEIEEHDFDAREVLLNLHGAVEEARSALKRIAENPKEGGRD